MATITINRSSEWNNKARKIGIYIDGEKVGTLDDGESQVYKVEPGTHVVYAKIDWCRSPKISIDVNESSKETLKLTGFKFGSWFLPIALCLMILYYISTYIFDIDIIHMVWMPLIALSYPTYFITFGKNKYLILTKKQLKI